MTDSNVRRANPGDLPRLLELAEEFCTAEQQVFDPLRVTAGLTPLLGNSAYGLVLVVEDHEVLGYAVLTWGYSIEGGGVEALLDEIFVADQGRGRGSTLITAVLEHARTYGAGRIFLETEADNARARGLYLRHGFTVENSVWMSRPLDG